MTCRITITCTTNHEPTRTQLKSKSCYAKERTHTNTHTHVLIVCDCLIGVRQSRNTRPHVGALVGWGRQLLGFLLRFALPFEFCWPTCLQHRSMSIWGSAFDHVRTCVKEKRAVDVCALSAGQYVYCVHTHVYTCTCLQLQLQLIWGWGPAINAECLMCMYNHVRVRV